MDLWWREAGGRENPKMCSRQPAASSHHWHFCSSWSPGQSTLPPKSPVPTKNPPEHHHPPFAPTFPCFTGWTNQSPTTGLMFASKVSAPHYPCQILKSNEGLHSKSLQKGGIHLFWQILNRGKRPSFSLATCILIQFIFVWEETTTLETTHWKHN